MTELEVVNRLDIVSLDYYSLNIINQRFFLLTFVPHVYPVFGALFVEVCFKELVHLRGGDPQRGQTPNYLRFVTQLL